MYTLFFSAGGNIEQPHVDAMAERGIALAEVGQTDVFTGRLPEVTGDTRLASGMGSIAFLRRLPGMCSLPLHIFFSSQLHHFSRYQYLIPEGRLLNSQGIAFPFSYVAKMGLEALTERLPGNARNTVFCRPDSGLKICEAEVIERGNYAEWLAYTSSNTGVEPHSWMWFFPVQDIKVEYRCLVSKGRVASISTYGFGKEPVNMDHDKGLVRVANLLIDGIEWDDPVVMVDIAETALGLKIVEANCFASSGLYALNPSTVADEFKNALEGVYEDCFAL